MDFKNIAKELTALTGNIVEVKKEESTQTETLNKKCGEIYFGTRDKIFKPMKNIAVKENLIEGITRRQIVSPKKNFLKFYQSEKKIRQNINTCSSSFPKNLRKGLLTKKVTHCAWKPGEKLVELYPEDIDIPKKLRIQLQIHLTEGLDKPKPNMNKIESTVENINAAAFPCELNPRDVNNEDIAQFNWKGIKSFASRPETFLPKHTGPIQNMENSYEAFRATWTDEVLDDIVKETNRHAQQVLGERELNDRQTFNPTNRNEILVLFAFYMMLGIVKYPTIDSVYSKSYLFSNSFFSRVLTRDRYFRLNRYLSFANNFTADKTNPLYKIQPIIDHVNHKFQSLYIPKKDITIDESLTLWKGLLNFKQYIPSKAARLGIKTFELCCSKTSYLWSFFVYTGRRNNDNEKSFLGSTVVVQTILRLINPLLGKGYTLWMDNWFNSPLMARYLKRNHTDCVGTLRANRMHVPPTIRMLPISEGHYIARHAHDVSLLAWQDKRRVIMISTYHNDQQVAAPSKRQLNIYKPAVVRDYNIMMGGVDRKDQMLEPYKVERKKCKKWYFKLFKRILNVSILNSRILVEESLGKKIDHLAFRLDLVDSIIKRHLDRASANLNVRLSPTLTRYQYQLGHFVDIMYSEECDKPHDGQRPRRRKLIMANGSELPSMKSLRKRCVQCLSQDSKTNIRVNTYCTACNVPLCVNGCFKKYHTPEPSHLKRVFVD